MPLKKSLRRGEDEYIPIKCEGWNGKFAYNHSGDVGAVGDISRVRRYNQNITNSTNFYGINTEPIILPPSWDGTFQRSGETYMKPDRNRSDDSEYYKYNTEPTVLPTTWNGEFQLDPNDVRIKQERNFSDARDFAEAKRFRMVSN